MFDLRFGTLGSGAEAITVCRRRVEKIVPDIEPKTVYAIRREFLPDDNRRLWFGRGKLCLNQTSQPGEICHGASNRLAIESRGWPRHHFKRSIGAIMLVCRLYRMLWIRDVGEKYVTKTE